MISFSAHTFFQKLPVLITMYYMEGNFNKESKLKYNCDLIKRYIGTNKNLNKTDLRLLEGAIVLLYEDMVDRGMIDGVLSSTQLHRSSLKHQIYTTIIIVKEERYKRQKESLLKSKTFNWFGVSNTYDVLFKLFKRTQEYKNNYKNKKLTGFNKGPGFYKKYGTSVIRYIGWSYGQLENGYYGIKFYPRG